MVGENIFFNIFNFIFNICFRTRGLATELCFLLKEKNNDIKTLCSGESLFFLCYNNRRCKKHKRNAFFKKQEHHHV